MKTCKLLFGLFVLIISYASFSSKLVREVEVINNPVNGNHLMVKVIGYDIKKITFKDIETRKLYKSEIIKDGSNWKANVDVSKFKNGSYTFKLLIFPQPDQYQTEFVTFKIER